VTLDESKMTVFKSGTLKVSKTSKPTGGQLRPDWISVQSELLKKLQKNPEKNITSEKMNNNIPEPKPAMTSKVCKHIYVDSRQTSRHQVIVHFKIKTVLGKTIK